MTTVLLVDDQPLLRSGLRMILEAGEAVRVVGEAGDGDRAVELTRLLRPDVVLMDIRMPGTDGIAATRRIAAEGLTSRVVVLTTFDTDDLVAAALRAGASGFLLKDVAADHLVHAVEVVARGDAVLAPQVTRQLLDRFTASPVEREADDGLLARLTEREQDVLALVARGLSNAEIAQQLHLQESTVKTHVSAVLLKLGVRDRVQAVVWWYDHHRS